MGQAAIRQTILVVEDEAPLATMLRYNLETVEIRTMPPLTRILDSRPQLGRGHVRAVSA